MKTSILVIIALMLLAGCGSKEPTPTENGPSQMAIDAACADEMRIVNASGKFPQYIEYANGKEVFGFANSDVLVFTLKDDNCEMTAFTNPH